MVKDDNNSQQALLSEKQPPQISLFGGQVILNPSISRVNFFCYLLNSMYFGVIFIPIGLLQVPLMSNIYHLSPAERAKANSLIQLLQLALKMLIAPLLGFLCDKYGRKFLVVFGMLFFNATIFITPNLPSFYPWYVFHQLIQEIAILAVIAPPLLADYIDYETKGRVAGLNGVIVYVCSFVATYVNEGIDFTKIETTYHQIGIAGMAISTVILLGLKGGAYHKKLFFDKKAIDAKKSLAQACPEEYEKLVADLEEVEGTLEEQEKEAEEGQAIDVENIGTHIKSYYIQNNPTDTDEGNQRNALNVNPSVVSENENKPSNNPTISMKSNRPHKEMQPGFMAGLKEAKNPWILISFICGFLMMSIGGCLNFVLVTYVIYLAGEDATNQAIVLTNKHYLVGALTALFFGFFADKYNKFKLLVFVLINSIIATLLLISTTDPYSWIAYLSMVFYGVAICGFMTTSMQLQSKYANAKFRASVGAVGGMFSVIGGASINVLGVYLMQYSVYIPFYLYLAFSVSAAVLLGVIYAKKKEILNRL